MFSESSSHWPLFSCIVPVKGPRPFFNEALESLRNQGLGDDLEIILQDADVEPDLGQSDAFNKGFAKARGEWFFWLNADDVLMPGTLKAVKELIEKTRLRKPYWITANLVYLNKEGRVTKCAVEHGWKWSYRGLPVRTYGPSSFFRRELLQKYGPFDVTLHYCMDTDLWCKFRAAGYWHVKLPRFAWGFRVHSDSKTSGALRGSVPQGMREEIVRVNQRAGVNRQGLRTLILRLVRILDGSTLKALIDTFRYRGRKWKDVL